MNTILATLRRLQSRSEGWAIGGVRILTGAMWLANLHWKVPGNFGKDTGGGLYKYTAAGAENAPFAPFRWALREIVLPNYTAFGWFTLVSEIVVAALLIVGYRTRLVALLGALLAAPIMLTVLYYPNADEWSWAYLMMIGLHVLLAAIPNAGHHLGLDGALIRPQHRARQRQLVGIVGVIIGVLGLFVARSISFAGDGVALLGSDAGFVNGGQLTRRWELKLLFFNPLWALATIVLAALVVLSSRRAVLALVSAAGFALMAVIAFVQGTYDYLRDDGAVQKISTGQNVAVWGGLAVAYALLARPTRTGPVAEST